MARIRQGFILSLFAFSAAYSYGLPLQGCLASGCHKDVSKKHITIHGPIKAGGCMVCHFASSKDRPKNPSNKVQAHKNLVKFTIENVNSLCLTCHTDIQDALDEPKAPHAKITEKGCIFCHKPHSSDTKKLFRDNVFTDRCLSCHDKLKAVIQGATDHHGAVTGADSCTNCHAFHATTEFPKLLKAKPETLCIDCHSKEQKKSDGRVIRPVGKAVTTLKFVHKSVRSKCTNCHQPHGSKNEHLLTLNLSQEFYSPFQESNVALCMDCHEPTLVTSADTKTDTEFRDGSVNLHFAHIVKTGAKGLKCLVCHDVHASSQAKNIRENFLKDGVTTPLQFVKTSSGGTCTTACHSSPQTYNQEKAVKNAPSK